MPALLPVILTATHLVLTAQEVPQLNIKPSCEAATDVMIRQANRSASACIHDEHQAYAKLKQQWGMFSSAERSRCVQLQSLGGQPSYVELLTCLQMARDAKMLPNDGGGT